VPSKRIYYTGTTGFVEVFKQVDATTMNDWGELRPAIAKTTLLVPELKAFLRGDPEAGILVPPIPQSKKQPSKRPKYWSTM